VLLWRLYGIRQEKVRERKWSPTGRGPQAGGSRVARLSHFPCAWGRSGTRRGGLGSHEMGTARRSSGRGSPGKTEKDRNACDDYFFHCPRYPTRVTSSLRLDCPQHTCQGPDQAPGGNRRLNKKESITPADGSGGVQANCMTRDQPPMHIPRDDIRI